MQEFQISDILDSIEDSYEGDDVYSYMDTIENTINTDKGESDNE